MQPYKLEDHQGFRLLTVLCRAIDDQCRMEINDLWNLLGERLSKELSEGTVSKLKECLEKGVVYDFEERYLDLFANALALFHDYLWANRSKIWYTFLKPVMLEIVKEAKTDDVEVYDRAYAHFREILKI